MGRCSTSELAGGTRRERPLPLGISVDSQFPDSARPHQVESLLPFTAQDFHLCDLRTRPLFVCAASEAVATSAPCSVQSRLSPDHTRPRLQAVTLAVSSWALVPYTARRPVSRLPAERSRASSSVLGGEALSPPQPAFKRLTRVVIRCLRRPGAYCDPRKRGSLTVPSAESCSEQPLTQQRIEQ